MQWLQCKHNIKFSSERKNGIQEHQSRGVAKILVPNAKQYKSQKVKRKLWSSLACQKANYTLANAKLILLLDLRYLLPSLH